MRMFLMAGVAALAMPATAQTGASASSAQPSVGTSSSTMNHANGGPTAGQSGTMDHSAHSGMNHGTSNSVDTMTQTSTGMDAQVSSSVSASGQTARTGTAADTSVTGTAATADTMAPGSAATGYTATGTQSAWNSTAAPASRYTMSNWNFAGDWGRIGTADWGTRASMPSSMQSDPAMTGSTYAASNSTGTVAETGVGGPLDIDSQWGELSSNGTDLTPLEFGTWMLEAQGQTVESQVEATKRGRAANLPAVQVLNVTGMAFAEADMDNDMRVSREELRAFAGA